MSDSNPAPFPNPFAMMMPGLDAMRQWAGVGSAPGTPPGWVAPTVSVEDLDKRIQELKVVQYWLEQNARMIAATVQGLEVQKMTLTTLQSMNVQADELAKALQVQPQDMMAAWTQAAQSAASPVPPKEAPQAPPPQASNVAQAPEAPPPTDAAAADSTKPDPVQWWGALNEQFQQLAQQAAHDWQQHAQRVQSPLSTSATNAAATVAPHQAPAPQPDAPTPSTSPATARRAKPARKTTRATPRTNSRAARKSPGA